MRNGESLNSNHANGNREEKLNRYSEVRISKTWCVMDGWEREGWTQMWEQDQEERRKMESYHGMETGT